MNEELADVVEQSFKALAGTTFRVENDGLDDKKNMIIHMISYPGPIEEIHRIGDLAKGKSWMGASRLKCSAASIAWTDSCGVTRLLQGSTSASPRDYFLCRWSVLYQKVEVMQIWP